MLLQFIKKTPFLLCAGTMLFFSSCNSEEVDSMDAESTATETDAPRSRTDVNTSEGQRVEGTTTNGNENTPIDLNTGSEGVKLNPPHGEPGHDCAVEVGAPLPSTAGASMPTINQPTVNPNPSVKLNPAHGQPGHDCAVEVGAPLN